MNHPMSARQQAQTPARTRRRDRRRSSRADLPMKLSVMALGLLVLAAACVRLFIGVPTVEAAVASQRPQAPAVSQTEPPMTTEPPVTTEGPSDTTAPKIMGVNKLSLFLGGTVAYRSGILVTDDLDPAPKLSVDSSQVDLSAPGTYPLIYSATDSAGNITTVETTVTVSEAPENRVDEAVIRQKADALLEKILTEGQTAEEQVNAIYDWIESHCYYIAEFDKTDYMQAAYLMMTENRGDCFGFYALSRLLFDQLGLPNLTVTRLPNEVRTTNHWWNMVSLDGGETWYHFDATPHMTYPTRTCLITDADLEAFNQLMPNYYFFDHASFPKTP